MEFLKILDLVSRDLDDYLITRYYDDLIMWLSPKKSAVFLWRGAEKRNMAEPLIFGPCQTMG